jgi:DNA-directed RNA polymerase subunit alpha
MSVVYGTFEMPEKIGIEEESASSTFARFVIEPFERGYGHTIGNSMRRMLLSSIESPALISVRIEGVPHEYMSVEGIVEDMTNIILNFKNALLRRLPSQEEMGSHQTRLLSFVFDITQEELDDKGGKVAITLGKLVDERLFEVVNPDLHLFTITRPMKRQVDLRVAMGRGYVPSERHQVDDRLVDEILVDSAFSPVRLVNYYVENTRVGQDTDFDRLILEVTTDGRITPVEAVSFAAQIGIRHFMVFEQLEGQNIVFEEHQTALSTDRDDVMSKLVLRISDIEFSVRASNCLIGADIEFVAELVIKPESELLKFRNFGKKSLNEIKAKLTEMGLHLGMDLAPYGITRENVKEVVIAYLEEKAGKS